ncbi:hypothetical protein D3C71_2173350 [compost metagenome]
MKVKIVTLLVKYGSFDTFTVDKIYDVVEEPNFNGTVGILDDNGELSALWVDEYEVVV